MSQCWGQAEPSLEQNNQDVSYFRQQDQCNMCTYRQNTTVFTSSILGIYYNRHNYMFRPLMLAIFRLYMNLTSSYTACVWCFWGVRGRGYFLWDRDLVCVSGGCMVWNSVISYPFLNSTVYPHWTDTMICVKTL